VERGFRFLKDRSFRVAEIYLKRPSRIQALAMVMELSPRNLGGMKSGSCLQFSRICQNLLSRLEVSSL